MQTRAEAEIVIYSVENRKPGDQRYEAQNDIVRGVQNQKN